MSVHIHEQIERLLQYGLRKGLITKWDLDYSRNQMFQVLRIDDAEPVEVNEVEVESPVNILDNILQWAAEQGVLEENTVTYRDLLDTNIMGCLTARPSEVVRDFYHRYETDSATAATKAFYQLSKDVHYIRTDRIAKNEHWFAPTEYGDMEITINLSKPEKDPKAIAAAKQLASSSYPECLLCKENVGFAGRVNHPARQNLRIIPLTLTKEQWYLQFSPYVYYNEHAIVFLGEHEPMEISRKTFARLLEFVEQFPHYFLGSNADLPIVGGSILSHDHFQGGSHDFPMAQAPMEYSFTLSSFPDVQAGIVKWPMSVIRLQGTSRESLVEAADYLLAQWQQYEDRAADIHAFSGETPHNTITPIARRRGELFEIDLVLRNNRTTDEHPDGLFHPHAEVHHIKKENIGLIEVMGLAVLPGRLSEELEELASVLPTGEAESRITGSETIAKHLDWAMNIKSAHPELSQDNVEEILRVEVGKVFATILEHAGVFKRNDEGTAAFLRFIDSVK
ncbi:UDP-glucose--hexose-1-phosphate uridylyltransferase [Alkalihalobacillus sp. MEB130]|uniref:UDP-glucose--hexose-1-phosphate uridylyltransferase n=1 Tax=Alkalihalobacillus sp. MEB130 TaxID=2976704 RepID=UPI0028DF551E|nr:UDP-glucose--hexose-1-phosphate uridylyltransferase [Alkalihalobacillus sp. MEB130]MDT8858842.1 UDP-glucose--hexose-1-phosphate uridylyltransferase [Alkalihalobacillus sp. MEB130]